MFEILFHKRRESILGCMKVKGTHCAVSDDVTAKMICENIGTYLKIKVDKYLIIERTQ